jgi:hypothetical protein
MSKPEVSYVYITTCVSGPEKGLQYVGSHCGDPSDGYVGSGRRLVEAIQRNGIDAFQKKILMVCDTREEAYRMELHFIRMYGTVHPKGLNLSPTGGTSHGGAHSKASRQTMQFAHIIAKHKRLRREEEERKARGKSFKEMFNEVVDFAFPDPEDKQLRRDLKSGLK